jgi:hypothetical protein
MIIRLLAVLLALILIPAVLSGCATMTESPAERAHNIGQVENYNVLEINEDTDCFWLVDHPSRLSMWIVR